MANNTSKTKAKKKKGRSGSSGGLNTSYLTKMGFRNLVANRSMSLSSISVLTACLLLIGVSFLLLFNMKTLVSDVEKQNVVVAFVKDGIDETAKKQELAAVGQCELMFIYDKFFGEYHQTVAQVLLTADVTSRENSRRNVVNTFRELLDMNIIPIVNENDTVAVDELEGRNFGDNDTLSAIVATLVDADALMILTDIDGVYDKNPKTCPDAKRIPVIRAITDEVRALAGGAGSSRGTGGMATKIRAAELAAQAGIPTYILAGDDPQNLYRIFDGEDIGTVFDC